LAEGQRKAHYEELDGEKKRNKDKIKQLKKEIKNLNGQLSASGQVCNSA
jgi:wobble nucleotide-excising tRNase